MKKHITSLALSLAIAGIAGSAMAANDSVAEANFKATNPQVVAKYFLTADEETNLKALDYYAMERSQTVVKLISLSPRLMYRVAGQAVMQEKLHSRLLGELRTVYKNLDNQRKIKRINYFVELNDLTLACHSDIPEMNSTASCDAIAGALADISKINLKIDDKKKIVSSDFAHTTFDMPFERSEVVYTGRNK